MENKEIERQKRLLKNILGVDVDAIVAKVVMRPESQRIEDRMTFVNNYHRHTIDWCLATPNSPYGGTTLKRTW